MGPMREEFLGPTFEALRERRERLSTLPPSELLSRKMSHDPSSVDPTVPPLHLSQLGKHSACVERPVVWILGGIQPVAWIRMPVARGAQGEATAPSPQGCEGRYRKPRYRQAPPRGRRCWSNLRASDSNSVAEPSTVPAGTGGDPTVDLVVKVDVDRPYVDSLAADRVGGFQLKSQLVWGP
jgi:hypothetical protein